MFIYEDTTVSKLFDCSWLTPWNAITPSALREPQPTRYREFYKYLEHVKNETMQALERLINTKK